MRTTALLCSAVVGGCALVAPGGPDRGREAPGPVDAALASAVSAARQWRGANEHAVLAEHARFAAIPSPPGDAANLRRNAEYLEARLGALGVDARLLEADGAPPLVFGELKTPGAKATYVFYGHYDGQGVQPQQWSSPPFTPTLRTGRIEDGGKVIPLPGPGTPIDPDWRLYARAASDDKGPITALLSALAALRAAGIAPRANLRFVFEGDEEIGSPSLPGHLERHREAMRGDLWMMVDGPGLDPGRQKVVLGARGIQHVEVTVYGADRDLHSGNYGNWAPNAAMRLVQLLASMRDADGRVTVAGFYDDVVPLTAAERAAIAALPDFGADYRREIALAQPEGGGRPLKEMLNVPALNVLGIRSGGVGEEARSAIPSSATARLEVRAVKGMRHERTLERIGKHIRAQGYHVVAGEPDRETRLAHERVARLRVIESIRYDAARLPLDHPVAQRVLASLRATGRTLEVHPTIGGAAPLSHVERITGSPAILVATVNPDNNQHAPDENLRLGHLWDAIETFAALLAME